MNYRNRMEFNCLCCADLNVKKDQEIPSFKDLSDQERISFIYEQLASKLEIQQKRRITLKKEQAQLSGREDLPSGRLKINFKQELPIALSYDTKQTKSSICFNKLNKQIKDLNLKNQVLSQSQFYEMLQNLRLGTIKHDQALYQQAWNYFKDKKVYSSKLNAQILVMSMFGIVVDSQTRPNDERLGLSPIQVEKSQLKFKRLVESKNKFTHQFQQSQRASFESILLIPPVQTFKNQKKPVLKSSALDNKKTLFQIQVRKSGKSFIFEVFDLQSKEQILERIQNQTGNLSRSHTTKIMGAIQTKMRQKKIKK